jgi:hypothetical protein
MADRARGDIAFEERLTRGDCEGLMIEQGVVVGATAIVTEDKTIKSTEGKLPAGFESLFTLLTTFCRMVPSFVNDEAKIITAANCTVLLVCDFTNKIGSVTRHWGTAFFISPTHLLTAAHICFGDTPNAKLTRLFIVHPPGLPFVNYTALATDQLTTLECTIVGTVYGKKQCYTSMNDIAILHAGSIKVPYYLPLSTTLPLEGAAVNVIGYPGRIQPKWIQMQPGIRDTDAGQKAAEILLPERRLTISQGKVTATGPLISYDVSTCPGMSGACVLYNDQIVGIIPLCDVLNF